MILGGRDGHAISPHYRCNRPIDCCWRIGVDLIRKEGTSRCVNIPSSWVLVWNKSSVLPRPLLPPPGQQRLRETQHRCGCWSQRPASEGKLITKGLSQSAMDFQLPWERWPWNSFSCEIWCWGVGQNRNWPADSFRWPAPNTGWIFQWWVFDSIWLLLFSGPVGWAERDTERNKKWLGICHRGNAKSIQQYKKNSQKEFWPSSLYLTLLSDFSISRDLQGPKGSKGAYIFFFNFIS